MKQGTSSLAAYYVAALKGLEQEKNRLEEEIRVVRALLARHAGGAKATPEASTATTAKKPRKKRELSAAARARIAAAQKKRWAEFRKKS